MAMGLRIVMGLRITMDNQLEDLLRACTVRITGYSVSGTGFFVAPGRVMTCAHVIGDSIDLAVRWDRDNQPQLKVRASRTVTVLAGRGHPIPALTWDYPDIGVLEVDGLEGHPCVRLDRNWPAQQDSFLVFGYPREGGGEELTPARLDYRGPHGIKPTAHLDLASDRIKPGMSGAALLNLRTGGVCGVVVASKNTAAPLGALAVPWRDIVADLAEVSAANQAFHKRDHRWRDAFSAYRRHYPTPPPPPAKVRQILEKEINAGGSISWDALTAPSSKNQLVGGSRPLTELVTSYEMWRIRTNQELREAARWNEIKKIRPIMEALARFNDGVREFNDYEDLRAQTQKKVSALKDILAGLAYISM